MSSPAPSGDPRSDGPPEDRIRIEPCPRWIRARFGGEMIVDTRRAVVLFERGHLPVYYLPIEDVSMDRLTPTTRHTHCPYKGDARYWSLAAGGREFENAAWSYPSPLPGTPDLSEHLAFYWHAVDAWFEEDEEVFVHPRDPYKRIDAIRSSRHVRIEIGGETVAETRRPTLLFETGLPTRYYIPRFDVRADVIEPSEHVTRCPYKGVASYHSVRIGDRLVENVAWYYPYPIPECPKIEGLVAFFDEHVDVFVDGERQARPETPWS